MPRPKRSVRASGVGRSIGAYTAALVTCSECKRRLPREAIHHITKKGKAWCGECWATWPR